MQRTTDPRFKYWYEPQDSPIWADLHILEPGRPFLLSASNIPDVLGYGYKSSNHLYQLYTGDKTPDDSPQLQEILAHGKKTEPFAIQRFLNDYPSFKGIQPGFVYAKEPDWIGCSIDHICMRDYQYLEFVQPTSPQIINLECKCPWTGKIPRHVSEVKVNHAIQTQYQMFCSGMQESVLYYYTPGEQSAWYMKRDQEFYSATMPLLQEFRKMVLGREPPKRGYFKKKSRAAVDKMMSKIVVFSNQ
jgi:hypothetical protein